MGKLVIDLQEGFSDDTVEIIVDGKTVFSAEHISTDYSIGLAKSVQTTPEDDTVWLEIVLPVKQIKNKILINIKSIPYVAASLGEAGVSFTSSTEPFVYF